MVSYALIPVIFMIARNAGAQCDVEILDAATVYEGQGMSIRMAWDRINDVPAVLWLDKETNEVAFRINAGTGPDDWEAKVTVDKAALNVPVEFDLRGYRMVALAFDSAGEPHVIITHGPDGVDPGTTVTVEMMYIHRLEDAGWTEPEKIGEMEMEYAHDESIIDMDFDYSGRLHVLYSGYGAGGKVVYLQREEGSWSTPQEVVSGASAMDAMVAPDGVIHFVFARRIGGYYQAWHKSSNPDGSWPAGDALQATFEPPIDCPAGPVSCWPAVTTDKEGIAYMAYGVDPDPCCNEGLEDPCDIDDAHDQVINSGHVSFADKTGGTWSEGEEVISGAKLHGPYPEILVDPTGVKYVIAVNRIAKVAVDPLEGSFRHAEGWHAGGHDWYSYDAIATGAGGWVAFTTARYAGDVFVVHFQRSGACGGNPMCIPDRTRRCGYCGTQTCGEDSQWGTCEGEGECLPEKTESCGESGTRTCGFDCSWGTCAGVCTPGEILDCGNCGTQTCRADASWGPCEDEGECSPGDERECGEGGTQVCLEGYCIWGECRLPEWDVPDMADTADVSTDATTDQPSDSDAGENGPETASGGCSCTTAL